MKLSVESVTKVLNLIEMWRCCSSELCRLGTPQQLRPGSLSKTRQCRISQELHSKSPAPVPRTLHRSNQNRGDSMLGSKCRRVKAQDHSLKGLLFMVPAALPASSVYPPTVNSQFILFIRIRPSILRQDYWYGVDLIDLVLPFPFYYFMSLLPILSNYLMGVRLQSFTVYISWGSREE